jgi:hypothetical protein
MKCKNCGGENEESLSNCCWVDCECGKKICGKCGSTNIIHDEATNPDDEDGDDKYWCCLVCGNCGLGGCAMCV